MISAFGVEHQVSKAFNSNQSSGNPTGGRRAAHLFGGAYHTAIASRSGRKVRNVGRDVAASYGGALPGAGLAGAGIAALGRGKTGMGAGLLGGGITTMVAGTQIARQKNLTSMNRKGYFKPQKVNKRDTPRKTEQRQLAAGLTLLPIAGSAYQASQAKKGRKAANFFRPAGRHMAEGMAGGVPGYMLSSIGSAAGKPGVAAAGNALSGIGQVAGRAHGGYAAMRSAQRRGDVK